jgi:hypothetical protein
LIKLSFEVTLQASYDWLVWLFLVAASAASFKEFGSTVSRERGERSLI